MPINPTPNFPTSAPGLPTNFVVEDPETATPDAPGTSNANRPPGALNKTNAEVNAIAAQLGVTNSPASGTVRARLTALEQGGGGSSTVTIPPGLVSDGTGDNYTAIRTAALALSNQGGGTVFLPPGRYNLSQSLPRFPGVSYQGAGASTWISPTGTFSAFGAPSQTTATDSVDFWAIRDLHLNPAPGVSISNDVPMIGPMFTREGTIERVTFGRRSNLVTGEAASSTAEESRVGTFVFLGHDTIDGGSNVKVLNCRGFGYYRFGKLKNIVDSMWDSNFGDANRVDCQPLYATGHVEAWMVDKLDLVNSQFLLNYGAFTDQKVLLIDSDLVRHNTLGKVFLDTLPYGLYAIAGWNNDFIAPWSAGNGAHTNVYIGGTARAYGIVQPKFYASGQEAIVFAAGDGHQLIGGRSVAAWNRDSGGGPVVRIGAAVTGARINGHKIYKNGQNGETHTGNATSGVLIENGATNVIVSENDVDPTIATAYSYAGSDSSVILVNNLPAAPTSYLFRSILGGSGVVTALDAGGPPTGTYQLTQTGTGWAYTTAADAMGAVWFAGANTFRDATYQWSWRVLTTVNSSFIGFDICTSLDAGDSPGYRYAMRLVTNGSGVTHVNLIRITSGGVTFPIDVDAGLTVGDTSGKRFKMTVATVGGTTTFTLLRLDGGSWTTLGTFADTAPIAAGKFAFAGNAAAIATASTGPQVCNVQVTA